ncbi:MAG: peptide chain release factor N(5)-glutamine methyltransferase [Gammaproteobacteria bacterium]|nr:peptide chain release factor N(5)-glutamine methyltransferase [Gammaproteobacteria bacterium]MBU1482362.1 peptide chain release factor N(5)-glutamine methyltransferase [Gammaproteobacteria bacterium]
MQRNLSSLLTQDKARLETALGLDSGTSRIEVQMLLQSVLKVPRSYLLAHPEQVLNAAQRAAYDNLLQRRLQGEPVAHILGEREFFGLSFRVTPGTLIPRPETELLVELALKYLTSPQPSPEKGEGIRVLDLGTGSGAIALSIAHSRPDVAVMAVDASEAALEVARENAQRLGIANVRFLQSDWFSALAGQRFDLIVSNPPYIAAGDAHLTQGDVRFEPMSALASGVDGLDDIRSIAGQAGAYLEHGAWLLLEHGYDQAAQVRDLLQMNGFIAVFSAKDIAGIDRVSGGEKP